MSERLKAARTYPVAVWVPCACWQCRLRERLRLIRVRYNRKHAARWVSGR